MKERADGICSNSLKFFLFCLRPKLDFLPTNVNTVFPPKIKKTGIRHFHQSCKS